MHNISELAAPGFSICIPCFNEEGAITETVVAIRAAVGCATNGYELIVVDDGSTDATAAILDRLMVTDPDLRVIHHDRNRGYGAALKTAITHSRHELIVITDADGTYPNERICELVAACTDQDMVVGARVGPDVQYSHLRKVPKVFLRAWASWIAGQDIPDINSGLRVFRRDVALRFAGILPNGFSFTTTITLAMLTTWCRVHYIPIAYYPRVGCSKIQPVSDTFRFLTLILRTGTYFAPVRTFLPLVALLLASSVGSLLYDIFVLADLTDKTVLLFLFTLNTGMFVLLSDMIDKRVGR